MSEKTERSCGYCRVVGHTARTCEDKKRDTAKEARKLRRTQSKKFYYEDSKSVKPLLDKLTGEGKIALLNNGFMRSAHFIVGTKPETAICDNLVGPMLDRLVESENGRMVEVVREPHFKTIDNKNKYLDYLVTVSFKGHKDPIKWLIEAEPPNQTHKGIEQIEDFDLEVPNVNGYRYAVTDGYHWHFCRPTIDSQLEWESVKIDDKSLIKGNLVESKLLDTNRFIKTKESIKIIGMLTVGVVIMKIVLNLLAGWTA